MTENTTKTLRQAENKVELVGFVAENKLEIKEFTAKDGTGTKYNALTGTLKIKVAENENHVVRFFAKELRKDGQPNQQFAGLVTVKDTVVSIADLGDNPEAKPTKVKVTGSMDLNEYYSQDGQLRSNPQVQGRFVNRLDADDPTENKATFDIEGVVEKLMDETDRQTGEETGRKKLTLIVPLYNSVVPIEFMLEGDGAEYAEDHFTRGASINLVGNMINFRKETTKKIEMGFGSKEETKVEFNEERQVVSGGVYEEGMHDAKIFDVDLIKEALVKRNVYLEGLKTSSQNRTQDNKPQGFGGATTPSKPATSSPVPDVSNFF